MTLIKSISGIRGTIGGVVGDAHRNSETIVKGKAFLQTLYDDLQQR